MIITSSGAHSENLIKRETNYFRGINAIQKIMIVAQSTTFLYPSYK